MADDDFARYFFFIRQIQVDRFGLGKGAERTTIELVEGGIVYQVPLCKEGKPIGLEIFVQLSLFFHAVVGERTDKNGKFPLFLTCALVSFGLEGGASPGFRPQNPIHLQQGHVDVGWDSG